MSLVLGYMHLALLLFNCIHLLPKLSSIALLFKVCYIKVPCQIFYPLQMSIIEHDQKILKPNLPTYFLIHF